MIEKRHLSIVDTRVPALSTPVFFVHRNLHPHRNQRFLVRPHWGACRMLSAGLCRIITQQSSCDIAQMTYVDIGCGYPRQSRDVHSCPPSMGLLNGNPSRSTCQGGWEAREGRGRCSEGVRCGDLMSSSGHGLSRAVRPC